MEPTSRFVGVGTSRAERGLWNASIVVDHKRQDLGSARDEEGAARLFDAAARRVGRPVNFPSPGSGEEQASKRQPERTVYGDVAAASLQPEEATRAVLNRHERVVRPPSRYEDAQADRLEPEQTSTLLPSSSPSPPPPLEPTERRTATSATGWVPRKRRRKPDSTSRVDKDTLSSVPNASLSSVPNAAEEPSPGVRVRAASSRYVGVHCNGGTRWKAGIQKDGKYEYLGTARTEEEVARLFDAGARKLGRPVNFPEPGETQAVKRKPGKPMPDSTPLVDNRTLSAVPKAAEEPAPGVGEPWSRFVRVWRKSATTWSARILGDDGKTIHLTGRTEEEAARLYDAQARRLGRPINFPEPGEKQAVKIKCGKRTRVDAASDAVDKSAPSPNHDEPTPASAQPPVVPRLWPQPSTATWAPGTTSALVDLARRLDTLGPVGHGVEEGELKACIGDVFAATGPLAELLMAIGATSLGWADGKWLVESVVKVCRAARGPP